MLSVLKRTVSMGWFFLAPKKYVKTDGLENINNFTLKNFVYLNLCHLLGNLKPVTVVKEEGEGSLFEKVDSEDDKQVKEQASLHKSEGNAGDTDEKTVNKHPKDTDDEVVVSELDEESTGEQ